MANAQSRISSSGWDIDSRVKLVAGRRERRLPDALGGLIWVRCSRRGHSSTFIILSWDFCLGCSRWTRVADELKITSRTQQRLNFNSTIGIRSGIATTRSSIVVDDSVGFVSGFDLTFNRWDTPEHIPGDARRRNRTALRMRRSRSRRGRQWPPPPARWASSRASGGIRRQVDTRVSSIPRRKAINGP